MPVYYRNSQPYRNSTGYRGLSVGAFTPAPNRGTGFGVPWSQPPSAVASTRLAWRDSADQATATRITWGRPDAADNIARLPFAKPVARDQVVRLPWGDTAEHSADTVRAGFGGYTPRGRLGALPWADTADKLASDLRCRYGQISPRQASRDLGWGAMLAHLVERSAVWASLAKRGAFVRIPWGPAGQFQTSVRTPYPVDPDPDDGGDPITVPQLPVYVMLPTISAVVLPERTPLELLSISLSTDASRYGWQFSGSVPLSALPLVNPATAADPVPIEVTVNGYTWVLAVEGCSDQRRFGARSASITGASRSVLLAQPYAPLGARSQPAARNASQLADEELTGTGWSLVWDAVDWLVPGGTWSYADQAPLDALAQLASSIGARIETDRTLLQLGVKPVYEDSPWEWADADPWAILPASILTLGDSRWQGGPNANGVYVYAGTTGFGALVKITGTAGENSLQMVTDKLLTSADPARERGRQALAAAGKVRLETVTLPLFPSPADPGLLPLGKLVDVQESPSITWRGQVQGVRIDASRSGGALSVRQILTVERQFR